MSEIRQNGMYPYGLPSVRVFLIPTLLVSLGTLGYITLGVVSGIFVDVMSFPECRVCIARAY